MSRSTSCLPNRVLAELAGNLAWFGIPNRGGVSWCIHKIFDRSARRSSAEIENRNNTSCQSWTKFLGRSRLGLDLCWIPGCKASQNVIDDDTSPLIEKAQRRQGVISACIGHHYAALCMGRCKSASKRSTAKDAVSSNPGLLGDAAAIRLPPLCVSASVFQNSAVSELEPLAPCCLNGGCRKRRCRPRGVLIRMHGVRQGY